MSTSSSPASRGATSGRSPNSSPPTSSPPACGCLLDDRDSVSPGVKFKDAELIGIPTIVVVGRGVADGVVEVRDRKSGDRRDVPIADAVATLATHNPLECLRLSECAPGKRSVALHRQETLQPVRSAAARRDWNHSTARSWRGLSGPVV